MASSWAHRTPPGLFGANQVPVGIFPGPIFSSSGRFPSLRDQNAPTLHRCKAKPQVGDRGHATWGRFGQSPPEATEFTNPAVPTGHLCHHWAMNKAGGPLISALGKHMHNARSSTVAFFAVWRIAWSTARRTRTSCSCCQAFSSRRAAIPRTATFRTSWTSLPQPSSTHSQW